MVKVKICGITNPKDARLAARLGADALGFNFVASSPRCVTKERALAIIESLPPFVTPVGVFMDHDPETVRGICDFCGIQTVQLHGNEKPSMLGRLTNLRRIKAFRLQKQEDIRRLSRYTCEAYLLDTYVHGVPGGTGATFNWEWAREASSYGPIVVAGGLTPENVAEAVRIARPYGVDVAGGVESEPGKKDRDLMAVFIAMAKGAMI